MHQSRSAPFLPRSNILNPAMASSSRSPSASHLRPVQSAQTYLDAPPSYDDIFPSTSQPRPSGIPSDHKIQRPADPALLHDWHSDSSVPSLRSAEPSSDEFDSADDDEKKAEDSDTDSILAQALEFTSHPVPKGAATSQPLRQPIAIPQVAHGTGLPFARAYSPYLAAKGVSMEEFVEFVDNLNVVSAGSPPLQVLDLVGGIVGMIPDPYAMAAGIGTQVLAKAGIAVVSKVRGSRYLRKANDDFFAPRGLKVELVTGDALRAKLGLAVHAPLAVRVEDCYNGGDGGSTDMSVHQRRVAALRGHASDGLTFDVPPPNAPTNVLDKMSAMVQKHAMAKHEAKALKQRGKYLEKQGGYAEGSRRGQKSDRDMRKLEDKMERAQLKNERKMERILQKGDRRSEQKLERLERRFERKTARFDRDIVREHRDRAKMSRRSDKGAENADKEARSGEKILWIYIDNL